MIPAVVANGRAPGAVFHEKTANRKLAPVALEPYEGTFKQARPVPAGPYMCATSVSIAKTCPSSCSFKRGGCYQRAGFVGRAANLLDERALGRTGDEVIEHEVELLDRAFMRRGRIALGGGRDGRRGRDLRLHIGGDVSSTWGARLLAGAADRWLERGGGDVFTFTHRSSTIERDAFGLISVLASVEGPEGARRAIRRGYVPAIVVHRFDDRAKPYDVGMGDGWRLKACPAETKSTTCVQCRACMNSGALRSAKIAIGFEAHGPAARVARRSLEVVS